MMKITRFKVGIFALSILAFALVSIPVVDAASKSPSTEAKSNKSDVNSDGVIDYDDLVLFSTWYLELDVETIDWCAFVEAVGLEDDIYGRPPSYYTKNFSDLLSFTSDYFGCGDRSDLNGDRIVNTRDLKVFSEQYANEHFLTVDWCVFQQAILDGAPIFGEPTDYFLIHYGDLVLLIQDKYKCTGTPPDPEDSLALENRPKFLTRIAAARNLTGDYYVTDAKVGSVFIYNSDLILTQELKGLAKPLGIAVNSLGHILVGNDKRNNVEVYDPDDGALLASFGQKELETPISISLDSEDNVYVTDAGSNTVYIYDNTYSLTGNIGKPGRNAEQLRSPSNGFLSADEAELFVLDRLNRRIQVYNLDGTWLRSITFEGTEGENCSYNFACWCYVCETPGAPPFTRLQSMDMDSAGMLHVLDIFLTSVIILNPQDGAFLGSYGSYGPGAGELKSPTSLLVEDDRALVVDGGKNTIEVLVVP